MLFGALTRKHIAELRKFHAGFCANLPQGARAGQYTPAPGDRYFGERLDVPDGRYRLQGSEWIVGVAGRKLVDVIRAVPPDFGGANVVEVPN